MEPAKWLRATSKLWRTRLANHSPLVTISGEMFEQTLASASPDMLREMIREFARRMMDADVEVRLQRGVRGGDPGPGAHSSGSVSRTGNSDRADVSWTRVNRPGCAVRLDYGVPPSGSGSVIKAAVFSPGFSDRDRSRLAGTGVG